VLTAAAATGSITTDSFVPRGSFCSSGSRAQTKCGHVHFTFDFDISRRENREGKLTSDAQATFPTDAKVPNENRTKLLIVTRSLL